MNINYITLVIILLVVLSVDSVYAQKIMYQSNETGRLPWVDGKLPSYTDGLDYRVAHAEGGSLKEAQNMAVRDLIVSLASERGVSVTSETILKANEEMKNDNSKVSNTYSSVITIKQDGLEFSFTKVGEYYEQYKDAQEKIKYRCWQLYIIGSDIPKAAKTISYSSKYGIEAGWRSLVISGWGQFYKKDIKKGVLFLSLEVVAIGSIIYTNNKYNYNINRALESKSLDVRKEYKQRADEYFMYRNISIAAGAACLVWSVIDAIAVDGAPRYALHDDRPLKINYVISPDGINQLCLTYSF